MSFGKVISIKENRAIVLFANERVQKWVTIPRNITDVNNGDTVAVIFESEMTRGIIIGVM